MRASHDGLVVVGIEFVFEDGDGLVVFAHRLHRACLLASCGA